MKRSKRAFDLVIAVPLLVLASPVLLAAMAAIRLSSPGPALFSQVRVGQGGGLFRCHKLRTMHVGTPSLPTHEAPPNAVTPIGASLRRLKIDELPQLWNVLRGEMSLVGPRPCLPGQTALIEKRQRLGVYSLRPGITGLAQVQDIDMSDSARCAQADALYLETASLGLDLKLVLRTIGLG